MKKHAFLTGFCLALALISCESDNNTASTEFKLTDPINYAPKGDRMYGINFNENINGFADAFSEMLRAKTETVELNIPWNVLEPAEGNYEDWNGLLEAVGYYGGFELKVNFSLALINTVGWEIPEYLKNEAPNSIKFINSFNNLIDWLIATVPDNVSIPSLSIGNEVDYVLQSSQDWQEYTVFFEEVTNYIHNNYPTIKVGVKTTVMHGLFTDVNPYIKAINKHSDVVMLNYYPQNDKFEVQDPGAVHNDLKTIVSHFPGREIWLNEIGYQSNKEFCKSSESKQAEFYHELFAAWDTHKDQIKAIQINWLHDQSESQMDYFKEYYGDTPALIAYLSSLGLRNYGDSDKLAYQQIIKEVEARGW